MLRSFSKIMLLVGGLVAGYFARPMVEPMISDLLGKFKK